MFVTGCKHMIFKLLKKKNNATLIGIFPKTTKSRSASSLTKINYFTSVIPKKNMQKKKKRFLSLHDKIQF